VTGAGYVTSDLAWLRSHADGDAVTLRDVSGEYATLGLWGPRARDILAAATPEDCDDEALPIRAARVVPVAGASVLASRISYAGELGWELTTEVASAVLVWDALVRAASDTEAGLEPFGYRALDSLRIEKGYRYYGTDMTMLDTPFEAGLGPFVRRDPAPSIGREGLEAARARAAAGQGRRLRTIHAGTHGAYLPVYGGEAVRADGEVVGRLRSAAFGPAIGATIGYVYLDRATPVGEALELDVFDRRVAATVVEDVSVDPHGTRMKG
jgi:4-methylaminobutanoate oxidase (formaldehyde-forming)